MAKYKIMIGSQKYKISMSDVTDYTIKDNNPTEDIIKYSVELEDGEWTGTIYAHIENPSQHTLYLIDQGRCFITINCKNFIGHSGVGYHRFQPWEPDDPRKTNPDWYGMTHSSGLGRGSYRFHKHWSLCLYQDSLLNSQNAIKVIDPTDIEIPIHFQQSASQWDFKNIKGYTSMQYKSDNYENPYRNDFYFDIRLALLTACQQNTSRWVDRSRLRVYQTKSKITRITFER